MTDAEIVRAVAEKVMEWQWYRSGSTGQRHLLPAPMSPWLTILADGTEPIYADWQVGLGFEEDDTEFNPLASCEDACQVMQKVVERGGYFECFVTPANKWLVRVSRGADQTSGKPLQCWVAEERTLEGWCRAVCIASMQAFGGEGIYRSAYK